MNGGSKWTAPFFVGLAAVVAAELALGLLLYQSAGFLRALTFVLAFEIGAFAVGMATIPRSTGRARTWRWLTCAGALFVAGVAALLWNVVDQVPAGLPRGITVLLFAALPMYTFGLVFAGMAAVPDRRPIGPAATFGATAGVLLTGLVLLPHLTPVSIYMFALLCVATAAILEGSSPEEEQDEEVPEASFEQERIPSIAEFAPDPIERERIPSIAEFAPDPPIDRERIPSIADLAPDPIERDPEAAPSPGIRTETGARRDV